MPWYMIPPLAVEDVRAGRLHQRAQPTAAEPGRRPPLGAAALAEPRHQVRPPAALLRLRGLQPLLRVGRVVLVGLVAGLGVARRVDQRGDVAAGGEYEAAVAAEQLRAAVAVLPWRDVVGDPG